IMLCVFVAYLCKAPFVHKNDFFIGRDLEPEDVGQVYFQDVESYREGFQYGSDVTDEWATFESGSENELGHIFQFERALESLMCCSLRRNRAVNK
ncbi:MAG TPA: hypothetical protein VF074_14835, partial [Pyrinomonadaceae bacterium]